MTDNGPFIFALIEGEKLEAYGSPARRPSVAGQLLDWITCHYTGDITLKEAAQMLGYEYHYLSRLLGQQYEINFRQLVNQQRVEVALHLLEDDGLSITDVALKSGF